VKFTVMLAVLGTVLSAAAVPGMAWLPAALLLTSMVNRPLPVPSLARVFGGVTVMVGLVRWGVGAALAEEARAAPPAKMAAATPTDAARLAILRAAVRW